jgi:nicotinamidase-related amidase
MSQLPLASQSGPFLDYLDTWTAGLPVFTISQAIPTPGKTAILSVDITHGFCYEGALSSPRVAGIVAPTTRLFEHAWEHGVRQIVLIQDTHEPDAVEFAQWPAHCVRGTAEAETVKEFQALPFFSEIVVFEKNSIASGLNSSLEAWVNEHPEIDNYIVVGDCTDLCTYQLAMFLRLDANERQLARRVIVPADCVQTYDMPVETAQALGILPHPGDLIHAVFLYHMQLNGIEVAASIQ